MRKTIFSVIIIFLAFLLFLLTYNYRSEQEQFFSKYSLSNEEITIIKDGDIILRHGYGIVSDMIVKTLNEKYNISHCAIIVRDDNKLKVIHTVSQSISDIDGIQQQGLKTFIKHSKNNSIIVVRFKHDNENAGQIISNKAKELLKQKVPFDHSFDINDDSELYCSELIWKILLDEFNVDIFPDRANNSKLHFNFSNFYNPDFFEVIINHH